MADESDLSSVVAEYPAEYQPYRVEQLGNAGGFSGAFFWRLHTAAGTFCVRRWPKEHPSLEQLQFIQAALWHVTLEGFDCVPLPRETLTQAGFVRQGGHFWELSPWLPGKADFRANPTVDRLRAAVEALAGFHKAAESFPVPDPRPAVSPGICKRFERLQKWVAGDFADLVESVRDETCPELRFHVANILRLAPQAAGRVLASLARASRIAVPLQVSIGDIWHDHVLYLGSQVSGLIDFGTMRIDSVSADLARLLGSMAGDDLSLWQEGIEAYEAVRPLSVAEQSLLEAFDQSVVLLSGLNWIDWLYRQRREFESKQAIPGRLEDIARRLEHLVGSTPSPEW